MNIDAIQNGIVIDHIKAGSAMKLYELMGLDSLDASVAMIMNTSSRKLGKKDIIKISGDITFNYDVIGYVDPGATVNVIKDSKLVEKRVIGLPAKLTNVIRCKNPRCISQTEQELDHVCRLTDPENKVYRCIYCDTQVN